MAREERGAAPARVASWATAAAPIAITARAGRPCHGARPPARYDHVIWIWFENHGRDAVIGSSQAPYFNAIARACGQASRYTAITHPSLPNYIAATSGGTRGSMTTVRRPSRATGAVSVFELARSWKSYQEAMPKPCALKSGSQLPRAARPGGVLPADPISLCARDVPLGSPTSGALATDLRRNRLPKFSFITPDRCNDMHDCGVPTGDAWLQRWLPVLLASKRLPRRQDRDLHHVGTEGGGGNRVATIAIAPSVRRGATINAA